MKTRTRFEFDEVTTSTNALDEAPSWRPFARGIGTRRKESHNRHETHEIIGQRRNNPSGGPKIGVEVFS